MELEVETLAHSPRCASLHAVLLREERIRTHCGEVIWGIRPEIESVPCAGDVSLGFPGE